MSTMSTQKYAWIDKEHDWAWTVAVISGRTADEVVKIYGGEPSKPLGRYTYSGAEQIMLGRSEHSAEPCLVVQIIAVDDKVVAVEPNGYTGREHNTAYSASKGGGAFFSFYSSVNGIRQIIQANDGEITTDIELLDLVDDEETPATPDDERPTWLAGVTAELEKLRSLALALMEQRTGVAFDRRWLDHPWPTYRIPEP